MQSLRQSLIGEFTRRIAKELGREATVRLLWPSIVGPRLAPFTQLKAMRGDSLVVTVPDRAWAASLEAMQQTVLDAVNRLGVGRPFECIQFIEDATFVPRPVTIVKTPIDDSEHWELSEAEAAMIRDENLRNIFLASARKYRSARSQADVSTRNRG